MTATKADAPTHRGVTSPETKRKKLFNPALGAKNTVLSPLRVRSSAQRAIARTRKTQIKIHMEEHYVSVDP